MNQLKIAFCVTTLLYSSLSFAKPWEYVCPDQIQTQESISKKLSSDWSSIVDTHNGQKNLENIGVFDGNPKENASLIPNNGDVIHEPAEWLFSKDQHPWMACYYQHSSIILGRPMPQTSKKCALKKTELDQIPNTLICE